MKTSTGRALDRMIEAQYKREQQRKDVIHNAIEKASPNEKAAAFLNCLTSSSNKEDCHKVFLEILKKDFALAFNLVEYLLENNKERACECLAYALIQNYSIVEFLNLLTPAALDRVLILHVQAYWNEDLSERKDRYLKLIAALRFHMPINGEAQFYAYIQAQTTHLLQAQSGLFIRFSNDTKEMRQLKAMSGVPEGIELEPPKLAQLTL